jgi:hypothetical protein
MWRWLGGSPTVTNTATTTSSPSPIFNIYQTAQTGSVWQYQEPTGTGTLVSDHYRQIQMAAFAQQATSNWFMPSAPGITSIKWYPFHDTDDGRVLWAPSAPAIITREEEGRREQEAYRRAVAEHNEQEMLRRLSSRWAAREQLEQRHREEHERRQAATERANGLLLEHLTPEQRETFTSRGWFVVVGGKTGTRYRVRGGTLTGNVDVMHGEKVRHRLCAHVPTGRVPMGDQLLAQKITLELAEDDFLRIANRHAA